MPSYPDGVGLSIAFPLMPRPVVPQWAFCCMNLHPPMNYNVRYHMVSGKPVAEARNELVEYALSEGCRYIFFLGDDVTVPHHTIRQMIYWMEHYPRMAVVGGVYCHKASPQMPMVFRGNGIGPYWDWKVGELFEVTGLGMDATMIRCSAFKDLEKPYFKTVDTIDDMMDGINKAEGWTEDLYFCHKLAQIKDENDKQKWKIYADGSLICDHWDAVPQIKRYTLPPNSKPMLRAGVKRGDKKIIDLGCGEAYQCHETWEGEVLRVDSREDVKPDYRCDIRKLPFRTGEFDIVWSSHTLEHFDRAEVPQVMDEWVRIMKPEGELRLVLPDMEWAARQIVNGEVDVHVMNVLYGAQTYDTNYHKVGFTEKIVQQLLTQKGFSHFVFDHHGYHMLVRAWKVKPEGYPDNLNPNIVLSRDNVPHFTLKFGKKEEGKPPAELEKVLDEIHADTNAIVTESVKEPVEIMLPPGFMAVEEVSKEELLKQYPDSLDCGDVRPQVFKLTPDSIEELPSKEAEELLAKISPEPMPTKDYDAETGQGGHGDGETDVELSAPKKRLGKNKMPSRPADGQGSFSDEKVSK